MNEQDFAKGIVSAMEMLSAKAQKQNEEAPPPRKSKIIKNISRVIPTAPYENITVHTSMEIEVEWQTPEELMKKSEKFNNMVIEDYKRTEKQILNELELAEKRALPNEQLKNRLVTASSEGFDGLD